MERDSALPFLLGSLQRLWSHEGDAGHTIPSGRIPGRAEQTARIAVARNDGLVVLGVNLNNRVGNYLAHMLKY